MKKNYSLIIDGQRVTVPDPVIISHKVLKQYARMEKNLGLIAAYDPKTHAGGFLLVPGAHDNPRWTIYVPLSLDEFTSELNRIVVGAIEKAIERGKSGEKEKPD